MSLGPKSFDSLEGPLTKTLNLSYFFKTITKTFKIQDLGKIAHFVVKTFYCA
jgi:hypothetical protein